MTLEQQVHNLEVRVRKLEEKLKPKSLGEGVRECKRCGETVYGSVIHNCTSKNLINGDFLK